MESPYTLKYSDGNCAYDTPEFDSIPHTSQHALFDILITSFSTFTCLPVVLMDRGLLIDCKLDGSNTG